MSISEVLTAIRETLWPGPTPAQKAANELIYQLSAANVRPLSSMPTHQMRDAVMAWHRARTIDAGTAEKFFDLIDEIDRLRHTISNHNVQRQR